METFFTSANRGSVSTGYDIENSLKLESDNNEHLYRAMANGNRRTWTYSCWIKRTELGFTNVLIHFGVNHQATRMMLNDDDTLYLDVCNTENELYRSITSRKFRDTSAWYHVVWRMDTTQSVAANRMKLYINGVEETSWSQQQLPPENYDTLANTTAGGYDDMGIGTYVWAGSNYDGNFAGYIAQVAHVDGQSYAPTEFGEFDDDSGIWKPKDVSGLTYGTSNNSFFLDFEDSSDLGANAKGNDANWSLTNVAAADQSTDTPTNNFCTYNNNFKTATTINATEGGTKVTAASGSGWVSIVATFGLTSGKWYWEAASSGHYVFYGIADVESGVIPQATGGYFLGYGDDNSTKAIGMYGINGQVYSDTAGHNGPGAAANTVVQIALDMDNRCVYFGANGSYISGADPTSGASKTNASQWNANWSDTVYPALSVSATYHTTANFGGYTTDVISSPQSDANGYGTFEYAPPSGYYAICTKNLAEFGG